MSDCLSKFKMPYVNVQLNYVWQWHTGYGGAHLLPNSWIKCLLLVNWFQFNYSVITNRISLGMALSEYKQWPSCWLLVGCI